MSIQHVMSNPKLMKPEVAFDKTINFNNLHPNILASQ